MRVNSELSSEEWVKVTGTANTNGPTPMTMEGSRLRWVSYSQALFSCRRHSQPRDPSRCDRGHLKKSAEGQACSSQKQGLGDQFC